jgi:hypothetical protein
MTTNTNTDGAVQGEHVDGYDVPAGRVVVKTRWADTKREADAIADAYRYEQGAELARIFKGGCLGRYRIAAHFFPAGGRS